jgi:phosphatidylglycerol:prolipoprotein diacylglycerol transferase
MHPILIDIGPFKVYSFGFMLALSFLIGIYTAAWRAKRFGVNPQHILDLAVYLIIAGVLGSRLLYVAFHLDEYRNPLSIFALWEGGATLYGGFLLAIFAAWFFAKKKDIDFLLLADILSPALALGIMLTRIGCFMSGCCFGSPTNAPWGVVFPPDSPADDFARSMADAANGVVALHPAQLYASTYGFVIFLALMLGGRFLRKRGATFGALLAFYGVFRFTLDFFRYYEENMRVLMGLTLNQVISVALFLLGLYLITRKTKLKTQVAAK